jgi:single-strand DNA-binding protein
MSLNRAMVIGNVGADPELRHLPSGQAFTGFSVATDESFTDKQGRSGSGWNGITSSSSGI